jgi:hypothetical protein
MNVSKINHVIVVTKVSHIVDVTKKNANVIMANASSTNGEILLKKYKYK